MWGQSFTQTNSLIEAKDVRMNVCSMTLVVDSAEKVFFSESKDVAPLSGRTEEQGCCWYFSSQALTDQWQGCPRWLHVNHVTTCVIYLIPSFSSQDSKEPPDCCLSESFTSPSCTLGVDLRRGRRRFSGNLQLPPLSWRQGERARTPDDEIMTRPTSLPFGAPPRIDITPVDPDWWVDWTEYILIRTIFFFCLALMKKQEKRNAKWTKEFF